jgi:hypothetical protein
MKIIRNKTKIKKNKTISQIVLYLSMAILVIGFLWSINDPDSVQLTLSYVLIAIAYILVQISLYMANKWGRSPRPDEIVENSLKGLNDQFTLYNYTTPIPHLLVGPAGIWILKPYYHSGEITYNPEKKRYEQRGGPNFLSKWFAQESLPNILEESNLHRKKLKNYFQNLNLGEPQNVFVANIFYSEKAEVMAKNAPEVTVHTEKLKDIIRSKAKILNLKEEFLTPIREKLPKEDE